MLDKPDIADDSIVAQLWTGYGLAISQLTFLPLGFDLSSAVFRAVSSSGSGYFVKLRRGAFDPMSVLLPRYLSERGLRQVIAPMPRRGGGLWADVQEFKLIVYPFVSGRTAREIPLSERQWIDFGAAVKCLHTAALPGTMRQSIPSITYSPKWRDSVKAFIAQMRAATYVDPIAVRLANVLATYHDEIVALVERADVLAGELSRRSGPMVVCHTDIHASNLLIDDDGALYIVDWDNPTLALKERDLMFAGGGQGFIGYTADEEETLFYRGYGHTQIDRAALTYHRCERIIEDIALACEQILLSRGGADSELTLKYLEANFQPGGTVAAAHFRLRAT